MRYATLLVFLFAMVACDSADESVESVDSSAAMDSTTVIDDTAASVSKARTTKTLRTNLSASY